MSKSYDIVKKATIDFTARFGFVTRDIFFEYLCPRQRTQKFEQWNALRRDQIIKPSSSLDHVYYLTKSARKRVRRSVAPARSAIFVEHDSTTASVYFELNRSGLLLRSWTDYELSSSPWDACSVLGTDRLEKIPDMVVDMKSKNGQLRIALETERSRKSNLRYDQASLHYLRFKNVNLVLYCCINESTMKAVERAFSAEVFRKAEKTPVLFLLSDFEKSKMEAEARFMGYRLSLKKLILAALKQPNINWQNKPDEFRIAIRNSSNDKKKCA